MNLSACAMFLLLIGRLQRVDCSLPDFTPAKPRLQEGQAGVSVTSTVITSEKKKKAFSRLPGFCRRLRRRRITILCNREKFCWWGRSQTVRPGQVCVCPRGSRCSHFFIHSL